MSASNSKKLRNKQTDRLTFYCIIGRIVLNVYWIAGFYQKKGAIALKWDIHISLL